MDSWEKPRFSAVPKRTISGLTAVKLGGVVAVVEMKQPGTDQTILYIVANQDLGWRKIGIGFGGRLDKWRREGWVIEQMATFDTREEALFAEAQIKRIVNILEYDADSKEVLDRDLPDQGKTEVWPIEWGTFNLSEYKTLVEQFQNNVRLMLLNTLLIRQMEHLAHIAMLKAKRGDADGIDALDSIIEGFGMLIASIETRKAELDAMEKSISPNSCEEFLEGEQGICAVCGVSIGGHR